MPGESHLPSSNGASPDPGFPFFYDERSGTWQLLDAIGNVQWRVFDPLSIPTYSRPGVRGATVDPLVYGPATLISHPMPTVLPQPQFALASQIAEASTHASHSSAQASDVYSGHRIEVLEQTVYARGLTSDYHLPDIACQRIRLRDALNNDFRSLAAPECVAWPESFQTPQKLAIVLCFSGYGTHSRQVNVLRHIQAHTLPPTRSKLAHSVASVIDKFLAETRDPSKYPIGPLSHGGRELTLDDLVLIDVQHASKGSLQPSIGVIVRA
ncbi:hypothetical protein C8T65DRAFT_242673 [Cerioporus squamosus]|nr:hypothetical protein C8T65DRAFT_242673 [Cerioporus squamosus]